MSQRTAAASQKEIVADILLSAGFTILRCLSFSSQMCVESFKFLINFYKNILHYEFLCSVCPHVLRVEWEAKDCLFYRGFSLGLSLKVVLAFHLFESQSFP